MRVMYAFFLVLFCATIVSCSKKTDDTNPVDDGGGTTPSGASAQLQFTIDGPGLANKTFSAKLERNRYIFSYLYDEEDDISGWFIKSPEPDMSIGGAFTGKSPGVYNLDPESDVILTLTVPVDNVPLTGLYSYNGVLTIYEVDAQRNKLRGSFAGEFRTLEGTAYRVTQGSFSVN